MSTKGGVLFCEDGPLALFAACAHERYIHHGVVTYDTHPSGKPDFTPQTVLKKKTPKKRMAQDDVDFLFFFDYGGGEPVHCVRQCVVMVFAFSTPFFLFLFTRCVWNYFICFLFY